MIEEWKIIKDFPDYQVSNLGRIKSFKKWNDGLKERILKLGKGSRGYFHIVVRNSKNKKIYDIHRLVLMLFKPINDSKDFQCNHIDGNKLNNNINNLEWCTSKENVRHGIQIGIIKRKKGKDHYMYGKTHSEEYKLKVSKKTKGENNPSHKLTENNIIQIQDLLNNSNLSQEKIANIFGVQQGTISRIKLGKTWKHVSIKEGDSNS